MADELKLRFGMTFSKGGVAPDLVPQVQSVDVTGTRYIRTVQTIGTSAEALTLGDCASVGYILVHNLDPTNFVQLGYDDTGFKDFITLLGGASQTGDWAQFRCSQAAPQAKADTDSCEIEIFIMET